MTDRIKAIVRALVLALGLLIVAHSPWAEDSYPARPIRWIVPWPAGGVADTQARIIAKELGKALGQQVMVDNRAGASGVLGADVAAKAKPDGYTLLYVSPNEQAIVAYGFGFATTVDATVKAGRLHALATTGASRSPQLPDVPTFNELGMPEMEMTIWIGMAGPAGLPPDIVHRLQSELSKILRSPVLTSRREFADSEMVASKPDEFRVFLAAERLRWAKLVKETGITVE